MRDHAILLLSCVSLVLASCSKPQPASTQTDVSATPVPVKAASESPVPETVPIDVCALLTSEEIQEVQGEPLTEGKPTQRVDRGLAMSDCYFQLPTFSNSVSMSVAQKANGPEGRDPAEFWEERFGNAADKGSAKSGPPQKVEGLGDDAYWTGDARSGALYVRIGNRYLRVSVGGAGDPEAKLKRSRALAEAALKRL